jgi:hypothetical protein
LLRYLEGFGEAKLKKYGAEILAVLAPVAEAQQTAAPTPTDEAMTAEPTPDEQEKNSDE